MQIQVDNNSKGSVNENSIVVLPFRNLSSDVENEYFSDGITEEIINALTKVKGLNVIARTSAFTFKGKDIDLRDIGTQLKVAYVLEGSVRKAGSRVRVTTQLVKASDGFHIFSETYDRELQDIFKVQDDISNKIAQKLADKIGIEKTGLNLVGSSTGSMEAYELYLKGRFNLSKGSLEAAQAAIQYFEAALLKDKNFVLPLAGLAACYTFLGGSGLMSANEAFNKAKEFAAKTNMLDENIAETHLALANSSFWYDWDFEQTTRSIKRAIQLSPGTASIHGFYAVFLMAAGNLDEALIEAQIATKLDPLSLKEKFHLAELFYRSDRYVEAIELFDEILVENPFFKQASILKAWGHLFMGEHELASQIFSNIPVTPDNFLTFYGGLAYCHHKLGQVEKVLECLKEFKSAIAEGHSHWLSYSYTLIFLALCETEKMFDYLEKSLNERITPLIFIRVDPVWDEFKDDARFISLVEKTFIPEKKDRIVTIQSDTRETLQMNLRQLAFVEAQENYSRFVWLKGDEIKERILRVTLKKIEDQIVSGNIVRCHRSYIINTNFPYTIRGNSNGYRLTSKQFRDVIPISRSLGKEIVARLKGA
jgi:TolB-like protein/DNA-binding LytR/AlgR family response regulator